MVALAPDAGAELRRHEHAVAADDGRRDPGAGEGAFHATFSVALQRTGSDVSGATPLAFGPRQCGQSAASEAAPTRQTPTAVPRTRCVKGFMPSILYGRRPDVLVLGATEPVRLPQRPAERCGKK